MLQSALLLQAPLPGASETTCAVLHVVKSVLQDAVQLWQRLATARNPPLHRKVQAVGGVVDEEDVLGFLLRVSSLLDATSKLEVFAARHQSILAPTRCH